MRVNQLAVFVLVAEVSAFSPGAFPNIRTPSKVNHGYSNTSPFPSARLQGHKRFNNVLRSALDEENQTANNEDSVVPVPKPTPLPEPKKEKNFNDKGRYVATKDELKFLVEEKDQSAEIAKKDQEISYLMKQKEQRETAINRLKFQMNEFKEAVEKSEKQKSDTEVKLDRIQSDSKKARLKDKALFDDLKVQYSKEKNKIGNDMRAVNEELEEKFNEAEGEKEKLLLEIKTLTSSLTSTTEEINKVKGEMNEIVNNSTAEVGRQQSSLSKKEREISELTQQKESIQMELSTLLIELDVLNVALEESKRQTAKLEKQMTTLQKESDQARKADQDLLAKLTSQFNKEKDNLSKQLLSFTEELTKVKDEKDTEVKALKANAKTEVGQLESELSLTQDDLDSVIAQVDGVKEAAAKSKKEADDKVRRQREESKRLDKAVKSVAAQQKKAFKREIWDLETKLEAAIYNYYTARNELKVLREKETLFENKIQQLEAMHSDEVLELENKMEAAEMVFATNKNSAKRKTTRLVEAFQRRLARRADKAQKDTEDLRNKLTTEFELKEKQLQQEMEDSITKVRDQAKTGLALAKEEFQFQLETAENESAREKEELTSKYETNLRNERLQAVKDLEEAISKKDAEIRAIRSSAAADFDVMKTNLTVKLNISSDEKKALMSTLEEKGKLIDQYEEERSSFRKLAKQTWKVTKDKIRRRGKKQ